VLAIALWTASCPFAPEGRLNATVDLLRPTRAGRASLHTWFDGAANMSTLMLLIQYLPAGIGLKRPTIARPSTPVHACPYARS